MSNKTYTQHLADNPASDFDGNEIGLVTQGGTTKGFLYSRLKTWLQSKFNPIRTTTTITADLSPAAKDVNYLIDASSGKITIQLPTVVSGNVDKFYFTMKVDSNHCRIEEIGGTQLIGTDAFLCLATINAHIELIANGVDGYDILVDGRQYYRTIVVTDDLSLTNGYESGALYSIQLTESQAITITVPDAIEEHVGLWAKFIKHVGDNASVTIINETGDFSEVISDNNGFTLTNIYDEIQDTYDYTITQDSRASESNVSINFFPTATSSILEPTYNQLVTAAFTESSITTAAITVSDSDNPQSLGFWIDENKTLRGLLNDKNISAYAQMKKTSAFNRDVQIKFKYYEYDYATDTLNTTELLETSYSSLIDNTVYQEFIIGGLLPSNTWGVNDTTGKTLVVELLAIKVGSTGVADDPTIDFRIGGTAPSKTTIDIPVASINHDSLANALDAGSGVTKGHVNNTIPLQLPERTTTEEGTDTHNNGQLWYNTTLGRFGAWIGGVLQKVLLITDAAQSIPGEKTLEDDATFKSTATFEDVAILDAETASTILSLDVSKQISSLPTTTYPSLAELALMKKSVTTTTSSATITPVGSQYENEYYVTALAENATIAAPTGTAVNGNRLMIRIDDDGTLRTLTFNSIYTSTEGGTIPPNTYSTTSSLYAFFIYNSKSSKWECVKSIFSVL